MRAMPPRDEKGKITSRKHNDYVRMTFYTFFKLCKPEAN
ncbi:hypothetical protein RBEAN4_0198 [Rickettsia bellii str. RML An4]|uniref:Uncharacterized protein n=1 Tax=Rickettsia bellii str. RML An4 TaxID=1359193 RepID=A0A0F3Q9K7_RICBE|nr:hypothetical protein RBEAN4_0198 [Rickettsia bellii str. RML An4]